MSGPEQFSNTGHNPDAQGGRNDSSLPQSYNAHGGNMGVSGPPGMPAEHHLSGPWNHRPSPGIPSIPFGFRLQICSCGTCPPMLVPHPPQHIQHLPQPPPYDVTHNVNQQGGFIQQNYHKQPPNKQYSQQQQHHPEPQQPQQQSMTKFEYPARFIHYEHMQYTNPAICSASPENQSGNFGGCPVVTHMTAGGSAVDSHTSPRNNQQSENIPEMSSEHNSNFSTQQWPITPVASAAPVQVSQSPHPSVPLVPIPTQTHGQTMSKVTVSSGQNTGRFASSEQHNSDDEDLELQMQKLNIAETGEDKHDNKSAEISKTIIQVGKQKGDGDTARHNGNENASAVMGPTMKTVDLPDAEKRIHSKDMSDSVESKTVVYERFVLMVSGLNPETLKEDLENYLESVTGYEVTQIKYTKDRCKAVVTFAEDPDLEEMKGSLLKRKRKLGSRIPEVLPLEVPLSIVVEGFNKRTSLNDIKQYFSNRASGNNHMVQPHDALLGPEKEYAVVSFRDETVVKQILSKENHTLEGEHIHIDKYYTEVGSPVGEASCEDDEKHENIDDLHLAEMRLLRIKDFVDKCKADFRHLCITTDNQTSVIFQGPTLDVNNAVERLATLRSTMDKYKGTLRGISRKRMELLMKQDTEEYVVGKLVKARIQGAWECDEQKFLVQILAMSERDLRDTDRVLNESVVEKEVDAYNLSDADYHLFENKMKSQYPQKSFLLNNQGDSVMVVTTDDDIHILQGAAKEILNKIQKKSAERGKSAMTESSSSNKWPEKHYNAPNENNESLQENSLPIHPVTARFLYKHKQDELKRIFSECSVKADYVTSDQMFLIKGSQESIEKAMRQLKVQSKRIKTKFMKVEGQHVLRLQEDGLVQSLVDYVETSHRCTVEPTVHTKADEKWHTLGGRTVYVVQGYNLKHKVNATMLLVDSTFQPFDEFSKEMLSRGSFAMMEQIRAHNRALLEMGSTVAVSSHLDFTDMFILSCATSKLDAKKNHLAKAVHSFLDKCDSKEYCSVALPVNDLRLGILDSWEVSQIVAKTLQVHFDQFQESKVRYIYLLSAKEDSFQACLTNSKIYLPVQAGGQRARSSRKHRVFSKMAEKKIEIRVIEGELSKQKVDVIVNTVDAKLDLKHGAISRTILSAGGDKLQKICRECYPTGLEGGKFAVTPATGKLKDYCQKVYHCCLPSRRDSNLAMIFSNMLKNILQQVSQDGLATIAIPALGTGNHGYDEATVAGWMVEAVRIHQKTVPDSMLREVLMVIFHANKNVLKVFKEKADAYNNSSEHSHEHRTEPSRSTAVGSSFSPSYAAVARSPSSLHSTKSNIDIVLKYGVIADEKADVIVNTVGNDLNLNNGSVSKSILKKAGPEIQVDLYNRYGKGITMPEGNYAHSIGGKLKCKYIYHVCLRSWKSNAHSNYEKEQLHSVLMKCLRDASRHGCKSIAFPALGTGMLAYPHDVVAREMYAAVTEMSKDKDCKLEKVIFVIFASDHKSKDAFKAEDKRFHARHLSASGLSTSQRNHGNTSYQSPGYGSDRKNLLKMYSLSLTTNQGDITEENSLAIVVPISPNMDFTTGIIAWKLKNHSCGKALESTCFYKRDELAKCHIVSVHGSGTCCAETIIFVNRDSLKTNQQMILELCLGKAENDRMCSISFPMLQSSGKRPETDSEKIAQSKKMAEDVYSALKSFAPTSKSVKDVRVIFYDHKMMDPFEEKIRDLMNLHGQSQDYSSQGAAGLSSYSSWQDRKDVISEKLPTHRHLVHSPSAGKPDHPPGPKLVFHVASEEDYHLNCVCKALQALCSESEIVAEHFKDHRLKYIDESKIQKIASLSTRFEIDILTDDLRKIGKVGLKGQSFGVCQAIKEIFTILDNVQVPSTDVRNSYDIHEQSSDKNTWKYSKHEPLSGGKDFGQSYAGDAAQESSYKGPGKKPTVAERIEKNGQHGNQPSSGNFNKMSAEISKEKSFSAVYKSEDVDDDALFRPGSSGEKTNTEVQEHVYNTVDEDTMDNALDEASATGGELLGEWFLIDDTEDGKVLQSYNDMNSRIELAYQNNEREVLLQGEDEVYVIDFDTMVEYVQGSEEDRVPVIRREKIIGDFEVSQPPDIDNSGSDDMKLVMVDRASQDFSDVKNLFTKASKDLPVTLVKIEKMKNTKLHQYYETKKDMMRREIESVSDVNLERRLWHGPLVNTDTIVNLSKFGFNRSYCKSGGERDLGDGVYFYPGIKPILENSKADASGHHHVCMSRVLTGKTSLGRQELRKPPSSSDSVVDLGSMPSKFAVFFDNQALPEYLVTFTASEDK